MPHLLSSPLAKFLALVLLPFFSVASFAQTSADQIFPALASSVVQILIIEEKSGSQAALGTGFFVADNRVATNYHVVSNKILEPEKYRIEVEIDGQTHRLAVVTADVVNDLAILSAIDPEFELEGKPFVLAQTFPLRGEILYSLGNPHNLGLTVVQGNYNGLVVDKFLPRIHFSGAINSGMSGGPTVNSQSEVVGINVATGGNQIGFLVPVSKLTALLEKSKHLPESYDLLTDMANDIRVTTDAMIEAALAENWPMEFMGEARVLGKTVNWFDCWGNSDRDADRAIQEISRGCSNADNIYINNHFSSGFFEYEFYYVEAPEWPSAAFYRMLAAATSNARPGNWADKDQVSNFKCVDRLVRSHTDVETHDMSRRVGYCVRAYKKLPDLYDVFFLGVSVDKKHQAIMDHFTLSGVSQEASMRFLQRFMDVLAWQ